MASEAGRGSVYELHRERLASEAFVALAELAARLKETGLLDLLVVLAENYDEALGMVTGEEAGAGLALAAAALRGAARGGGAAAARGVEEAVSCLVEALGRSPVAGAEPVGLTGLIRALADPRVARGLGVLLSLAAAIGECVERRSAGAGGGRG